jgi:hypothetical protein
MNECNDPDHNAINAERSESRGLRKAWIELDDKRQELETELTAAQEELAEWRILNGWGGTPEIINDFIKGQQTRIHYAQNLEEELTAVTEQRDRLAESLRMICVADWKTAGELRNMARQAIMEGPPQ